MGGTTLEVLSPYTAGRVEAIVREEMIAEGLTRYDRDPRSWYSADGLPYGYDIHLPSVETEPEDLQLVERATGVTMRCAIGLHIFVSEVTGRPALARVAQQVARRSSGWVFVEFQDPPCADLLRCLGDAGRYVRVDDAVYLDAAAMTRWAAHPGFHVVK
jgi:hypothetical protein